MKKIKMDEMTTRIAHRVLAKVMRIKDSLPVIGRETGKVAKKKIVKQKTTKKKTSKKKTQSSKRGK